VDGEPRHRVVCVRAAELPAWRRRTGAVVSDERGAAGEPIVDVHHLTKVYEPRRRRRRFGGARAPIRALADVSLTASRRQTLAIVGESGCGKSTLAKILSGIEVATAGGVTLDGAEIGMLAVDARSAALRRKLQMVFQNPDSTLNPSHTVGYTIGRALRRLHDRAPADVTAGVARLLEVVRLSPSMAARKPHHLSGGEKQRIAIARALAGDPDVIVADEPVSALDVSVQAAVINLLNEIQAAHGATLVFISHDLGVVRYLADHVAVMYLGTVAEVGRVERVFAPPYHPYTEALLSAVPVPDPDHAAARILLEGPVPRADEIPRGCPFATRCPRRVGAICDDTPPPVQQLATDHGIACHIPGAELRRLQTPLVAAAVAER
jgi:peptide/nickel transport system ATP-binding protein